ncbi:Long-chain-fatty-acid--CoA ligase 5 [Geranomyces variabilis]|nr:Long-chain-fatty-acid--CoA ligase 5 [Geranomyces variabilis]
MRLSFEQLRGFSRHSVELPGTRVDGAEETGVFRSIISPDKLIAGYDSISTSCEFFERGASLNPSARCLGYRPALLTAFGTSRAFAPDFTWQTYAEVATRRLNFAHGLQSVAEKLLPLPSRNDPFNLGIYSINRPEWIIADLGAGLFSNPTVALYDTLGPDAVQYILLDANVPGVVLSRDKAASVIACKARVRCLRFLIVMDNEAGDAFGPDAAPDMPALRAAATKNGLALYTFSEVEALGAQDVARPLRLPNPESPLVICYTSGTTGTAKGVILTHRNVMSTSAAVDLIVGGEESCEVHISYLPLAHVFEKNMTTNMMGIGGAIGFYHGDTTALLEDMQILKPTIFPSVPRLLNRIYDKVLLQVSASPDGAKQFAQALAVKANHMKKTGSFEHPVLDKLVFNKIKQLLGGEVKHILSASAPLSKDVKAFCRIAFSAMVVELYGQTENNGALTMSWPTDLDDVHVGGPVPCNEVKLVSVPEMGYLASRNEGEIWVRGPDVTPGYLNQPAKTRETITDDGWLKTGDIAKIDHLGRFIIVDRKKNIFKLSQGEYVAPEKVENIYARSPFIAQIYVHGDSHQSQLVALVVPDPEAIAAWAAKLDPTSATATKSYASWCSDNRLLRAIETDMLKVGRANNLSGIETVRAIRLLHEPFSAENGLMTPTFKLKRPDVAKAYRHTLDELYAGLKAVGSERAKL